MQTAAPKVLVVDDREENLIATRHILKQLEAQVVCAYSGNEALKQLLHHDFAVVLMDVQMPDMNGFETAELIRGNEDTKSLPIIFVTAINKEEKYVQQGYRLGAVDYLFKPLDPGILRYKVGVFLELFRQRRQTLDLANQNQLILDAVKEGVLGLSSTGSIVFSNPAASQLLCCSREQLLNQPVLNFIQSEQGWGASDMYTTCNAGLVYKRSDGRFCKSSGETFPVEYTFSPMYNKKEQIEGFVLVFEDISARLKAEQQLIQLAEYDPLTGLANRRLFYRLLPNILAKARRCNHKVALLYIDLDHFKSINDSFGHVMGDLLLTQVARRLTESVRKSDTVVRLSGDEFAIILEGDISDEGGAILANTIIGNMSQNFELNQNLVRTSISIGIAVAPDIATDADALIKAADTAMYSAKVQGGNNYKFYDESLSRKVSYRAKVETHLQEALEKQEFKLFYQPKVDIQTGALRGFESLLRWQSRQLGGVSPSTFIPIAEDTGRIHTIGNWVICRANRQLREWVDAGVIDADFTLSINLSFKQLTSPDMLLSLENAISEVVIDPRNLDIEITESSLMSNPEVVIPLLRVFSEMGMTISVDDFGTGYSSLSYLKMLPIHNLKIDQSFIRDLFRDSSSRIITRSIINLAHNLDLSVVAEGIETREQWEFLLDHGCNYGQGYLYSKPVPPEEAVRFFRPDTGFPGVHFRSR